MPKHRHIRRTHVGPPNNPGRQGRPQRCHCNFPRNLNHNPHQHRCAQRMGRDPETTKPMYMRTSDRSSHNHLLNKQRACLKALLPTTALTARKRHTKALWGQPPKSAQANNQTSTTQTTPQSGMRRK